MLNVESRSTRVVETFQHESGGGSADLRDIAIDPGDGRVVKLRQRGVVARHDRDVNSRSEPQTLQAPQDAGQ